MAGIAQYAVRAKQYLVMTWATDDGLVMQQPQYAREAVSVNEVRMGDEVEVNDAELALTLQIIEMSGSAEFQSDRYRDAVCARLEQMIEAKLAGQEIRFTPQVVTARPAEAKG